MAWFATIEKELHLLTYTTIKSRRGRCRSLYLFWYVIRQKPKQTKENRHEQVRIKISNSYSSRTHSSEFPNWRTYRVLHRRVYLKNKVEAEIHAKYESASQSVKDTTVIVKGKAKEIFTEENIDNAKVKLEDAKTSTLSFISDLKEASESKEGEDNE